MSVSCIYISGLLHVHVLSIILKVARDKEFEWLQRLHKGKVTHRPSEINRRNKKAEEMINNGIEPVVLSATTWEVQSRSHSSIASPYVVQLQGDHECICKLVCASYKVSVHAYTCPCIDYAIHSTACKHVHNAHGAYGYRRGLLQYNAAARRDQHDMHHPNRCYRCSLAEAN